MILTNFPKYDGSLIHNRFAYRFLQEKTIALGNIISFRAPMDVTTNLIDLEDKLANDYIWSDDALNFCWEIPILDNGFGAVAFQRLFVTQVANVLYKYINKPIEVDGDDIIVHAEHNQGGIIQQKGKASVSITYIKDRVTLGHLAINVKAGKKAPVFAYSTNMSELQCGSFLEEVEKVFYKLCDDLFVASAKVQI